MYLPQFLVGMFTTSTVVAMWTYIATGSFWKALTWTVLALIVLQVGYFLLAFGLFHKRSTKNTDAKSEPVSPVQPPLRRNGGVSSPGGQ
jgi:exopolysaccharide production repressor protein